MAGEIVMVMIAIVAGLLSMVTSLAVGIKLVRLAGRTHQMPELLIGMSLVLMGFGWSALSAAGRQGTDLSDPMRVGMLVASALCAIVGTVCLSLFNWRVYHPGVAWPGVLTAVVGLSLVAICLAQTFGVGWLVFAREEHGPWRNVTWINFANYVWSAIEAWTQQQAMQRRSRIGLADPVVLDRVRLWTITLLAAVAATFVFGMLQTLGVPIGGTPIGLGLTAVISLISSATLFLAFSPPSSYLASVRRRAVATA
jgi:hypothetical protein